MSLADGLNNLETSVTVQAKVLILAFLKFLSLLEVWLEFFFLISSRVYCYLSIATGKCF